MTRDEDAPFRIRTIGRVELGIGFFTRAEAESYLGTSAPLGWDLVPSEGEENGLPFVGASECEVFDLRRVDDRTAAEIERDALQVEVERLTRVNAAQPNRRRQAMTRDDGVVEARLGFVSPGYLADVMARARRCEAAESEVATLRADVEQLVRENDQLKVDNRRFHSDAPDETQWSGLVQSNSKLRVEVERLKALMREARADFHGQRVLFSSAYLNACDEDPSHDDA